MKIDGNTLLSIYLLIVLALYLTTLIECDDKNDTNVATTRVEPSKVVMAAEVEESVEEEGPEEEPVESIAWMEPAYFDVPLSEEVQAHIFAVCDSYRIDPALVIAIIERESNFDSDIVGDSGNSFGLMQINKQWHEQRIERLGVTDLLDPCQNITVGVDYLAELKEQGNNLHWLLMAYNGGASYADEMITQGLVSEYALEVLMRSKEI